MSIEVRARQYGTVFGDWKFDEKIGSGSSGKTAVFRLKRSHFEWHEDGALKVVPVIEESGKWEQFSDFFKNDYKKRKQELCKKAEEEVRIMYKIHGSAYVVNYLDFTFHDWKDGNSFGCDMLIRMELLENLREEMKCRTTYTEKEIIKIGKDICKALICCHKENIIHRDIKPENIFKNKQGDYKLGDFGISRIVSRSQSASTKTGTEAYAAPEQFAQSSRGEYDYRVDIYSLGLILYELSNGNCLPFATSAFVGEKEIQMRIIGKILEKPRNASAILGEIILKACAYQPERRYQSAQEFLDALCQVEDKKEDCRKVSEEKKKSYFEMGQRGKKNNYYETVPASAQNDGNYDTIPANAKGTVKTVNNNVKDAKEQFRIGTEYYYGFGVKQDYKEAVKWYQKAAEQGNVDAQTSLGDCYYNGEGVGKDYKKAVEWYLYAATLGDRKWQTTGIALGNANAMERLGDCYYNGNGVKKNYLMAVEWYERALEKGNGWVDSKINKIKEISDLEMKKKIAFKIYYCGSIGKKNYKKAVIWYKNAAEQGQIDAQMALGSIYYEGGEGVEKDYEEALKWYKKAEKQGDIFAQSQVKLLKGKKEETIVDAKEQYRLGNEYYYGFEEKQNYGKAVEWYQKAAEQGNADAQVSLGDCYYNGEGISKNYERAVYWYTKSAKLNNANGMERLGDCYCKGNGVKQDYMDALMWYEDSLKKGNGWVQSKINEIEKGKIDAEVQFEIGFLLYEAMRKDGKKAIEWYQKAAEQENANAQEKLAFIYHYGGSNSIYKGVVKENCKEAIKWYEKLAIQGDKDAQRNLANIYYYGEGNVEKNYKEAMKWYEKAAMEGDSDAYCGLGECYYYGRGIEKNYKKAVKWYRKAAEHGNEASQYSLGWCYQYGQGVEQDYQEALKWYEKCVKSGALNKNNAQKQINEIKKGQEQGKLDLSGLYWKGRKYYRESNYAEAIKCYTKAAEYGYIYAQRQLGDCYYKGECVEKDYTEAVKWYEKAAVQGDSDAQCSLGECYYNGYGVQQDYQEAVKWYEKAAMQENKTALYKLGVCYYNGHGVKKNYEEAIKNYQKAADKGFPYAQSMADKVRRELV